MARNANTTGFGVAISVRKRLKTSREVEMLRRALKNVFEPPRPYEKFLYDVYANVSRSML